MAITYVGRGSSSSSTVTLPTFQAGDVAVGIGSAGSGGGSITLPTGWANLLEWNNGSSKFRAAYRSLKNGDSSSVAFSGASSASVVVYRGVDQNAPVANFSTWVNETSGTTYTAPSVSGPAGSNRYVAVLWGLSGTDVDTSSSTSLTNRSSGWAFNQHGACDGAVSGSFTTEDISLSVTASTRIVVGVLLREPSLYPVIADQDTTSGTVTSNSSSWTLTYPTNIAAGDLLIAVLSADGSGSSSLPTGDGWNFSSWVAGSSGANYLQIHRNKAPSALSGTFTATMGASEQGSWLIYRIPSGTWHGGDASSTVATDGSATSTGSPSANPDPPSLNPNGWDVENTLWLAFMGADTSRTVSAYPIGFTNTGSLVSGGSGGATLGWGRSEGAPVVSKTYIGVWSIGASATSAATAQSFLPLGVLTSVSIPVSKTGNPTDNLILEIQTGASGVPSGTVVSTLVSRAGTSLSTSDILSWSGSISLSGTHWLVLRRSGSLDASNYYGVNIGVGDYSDGDKATYDSSVPSWSVSSGSDIAFTVVYGNASSVDPGTFTISSSDDWVAATIAIRPFVPASPTDDPRQVRVYRQVLAH